MDGKPALKTATEMIPEKEVEHEKAATGEKEVVRYGSFGVVGCSREGTSWRMVPELKRL